MAEIAKSYGVIAEFETAAEIVRAAATVRDTGFRRRGDGLRASGIRPGPGRTGKKS